MSFTSDAPAALAGRPLFEPIAERLGRHVDAVLPPPEHLDALLQQGTRSGGGMPIRFVPPTPGLTAYEEHIFNTGEVPTRAHDWHDYFNALAWCVWPRTKHCCNALHLRAQGLRHTATVSGRGPLRDALTQFDECGIVVVSSAPAIIDGLAAHAWEEVFWRQRAQLLATTRFLVIGHGIWDQLRNPFVGLCAKAIYRVVDAHWLYLPPPEAQAECDAWLAAHLAGHDTDLTPRSLSPLPLLGVPGVVADSECADYYRDTRQFRPRRGT
ncbi:DUF3025 domain-containing protein [Azoarcus sp. L1K30]|uniref:DUF3025 domain-containing protein n=1 Tax=Azoarcus sp. L1K30 TaxID=2820277 RepID=UPI001B82899A|nr:DUF3025 domain-containing protein [Azoarcus sp. L1K30]MBR0568171.1 DUF3025 domain-containing protein [Azoarcus sp. L1K30]